MRHGLIGMVASLLCRARLPADAADAADSKSVCQNPLFEMHWFSPGGSDASLCEKPSVDSELRLCPAYNGRQSCCQESFESEQNLHFSYWRQILTTKISGLKMAKMGTLKVKQDAAFNAAASEDRAQFSLAIAKYNEVLDPARGHARCFAALLSYAAGMMCFACDASWADMVETDDSKIIRVLIDMGSCQELWRDCEAFGTLAKQLREAILDSSLAVRSATPVEHLEMFQGQHTLCDWAHETIAMHPFTQPSEAEREATPPMAAIYDERRLSNATAKPKVTYGSRTREYDVMKAGRASGFNMVWAGLTAEGGATSLTTSTAVLLAVTATACTVSMSL
eukprot:TRINITY_DN94790_c0_g1_i1.p1 TRINITY_DN94790_c0_g1~~TRINITY_DN94790_c0_g1_i1.p1  ORF type:complete len:337 (-),score=45.12 TRINITY_DN94790_c0_g1_i1:51-1061(-)